MNSYTFKVQLEPDEEGWRACYAPWEEMGASTWGKTQEEALKNIEEVLSMMLEEFVEEGRALPDGEEVFVTQGPAITVNL